MTEQLPFKLIAKEAGFEVRHYPKHVLVQVRVKGDFNSAGNQAFRPLVNYISGANTTREKFAMTAPVIQAPLDQIHTVSFVLPEGVSLKELPLPLDSKVTTVEVEPHYAAAITFRGLASWEHFKSFGDQLLSAVQRSGLKAVGDPYYARFDPPWKPGFLRRNEALVALESYPSKGNK